MITSVPARAVSWHAAFPAPKAPTQFITRGDVLDLFTGKIAGKDFILIDVRRTDFEGGTIKNSINLPAHSMYITRQAVYDLMKAAGIQTAVFYCGSSNGRGPRAAGWLQDVINEKGDKTMKSVAMEGGIKGWVNQGIEFTDMMEGYQAAFWENAGETC